LSSISCLFLRNRDATGFPETLGGEIAGYGPKEADAFVREQTELWAKLIRLANIKPD